jgi:hypothetical protein
MDNSNTEAVITTYAPGHQGIEKRANSLMIFLQFNQMLDRIFLTAQPRCDGEPSIHRSSLVAECSLSPSMRRTAFKFIHINLEAGSSFLFFTPAKKSPLQRKETTQGGFKYGLK